MYVQDTIVAPATPPGPGAVAIVRLSGPAAIGILRSIWRPLRADPLKPRRFIWATSRSGDRRRNRPGFGGDHARPPESDRRGRGGVAMPRRAVPGPACDRPRFGLRRPDGGAGRIQPARLSQRQDGPDCGRSGGRYRSRPAAKARWRRRCRISMARSRSASAGLRDRLIAIAAHLEVEIDFSDEDIAMPSRAEIAGRIDGAARRRADAPSELCPRAPDARSGRAPR